MVGPFTFVELIGGLMTLLFVAFAYAKSDAESWKARVTFAALTGISLTVLLSLRFYLLPIMEEDLRIQNLSHNNEVAGRLFDMLTRAPSTFQHPLFEYIVRVRLGSLDEYFDRAIAGRFVVDQTELPTFLLQMVKDAKSSILATSYAQPASWWDQPWGKLYETENEQAVRRGVHVDRTFLFANETELNGIRPLLENEAKSGIAVGYAFVANLHSELVTGLVCIDDRLAGELHFTPTKSIKEAEFFTRPSDIAQIRERIARVNAQARLLLSPPTT